MGGVKIGTVCRDVARYVSTKHARYKSKFNTPAPSVSDSPAIIIMPFCPCRRYAVFVTENIIIFHLSRFLWSWRESNPRPNTLQERFLHAYPWIGFRPEDGTRLYRRPAYPLKFRHRREAAVTYLPLSDASVRTSGRGTSGETASCVSYG